LISITLAGLFTFITSSILHNKTLFGIRIVGNAEGNLLFIVFIGTFLLSAIMLATSMLKRETLAVSSPKPQRAKASPKAARKVKKVKKRKKRPKPSNDMHDGRKRKSGEEDDALKWAANPMMLDHQQKPLDRLVSRQKKKNKKPL